MFFATEEDHYRTPIQVQMLKTADHEFTAPTVTSTIQLLRQWQRQHGPILVSCRY